MKIGDTVQIKSYEYIRCGQTEEISYGFYTGNHFFDFSMKSFCGDIEKIDDMVVHKVSGNIFKLRNGWWWLEKWLIPEDFLSDMDFDI